MINKRLINTGEAAPAAFDPLQNFETVTYTGNGGTQKITGYIRKGAAFNGSSSYISADNILDTSSAFTYSLWINPTTISSLDFLIGHQQAGSPYAGVSLLGTGSNKLFLSIAGGTAQDMTPSLTLNSWSHIVLTHDGSGNYTCYTNDNGSPITYSGATSNNNSNPFRIGFSSVSGWGYFDGKVDQVRIFDKALSSSEVTTLYGETYASSTKSTTDIFGDGSGVALYELDDDANSSNFEQAAVFNGSSSYINLGSTIDNPLRTAGAFGVSVWFNASSYTANQEIIHFLDDIYLRIYINASNQLEGIVQNSSSVSSTITTSFSLNTWYHVVLTGNSANGITLYLNGSSINNTSWDGTFLTYTDTNYKFNYLGYSGAGLGRYNGKIDQVRIYSSALSSGDVTNLYNESSVPTANLVAHYKLDGDATDETGTYNGTASNVTYSAGVYGGTPTNVNFLGMAFQPDLVWIKARDNARHHRIFDSVRGENARGYYYQILSATTEPESNYDSTSWEGPYGGLTSLDSNGFTVEHGTSTAAYPYNGNENYVAWCWKAGGTAVSNTDGTITSQVSANPDAGFSIVKFPTTATNVNVGHGLSQAPEMIIYKNITYVDNWYVYHKDLSSPNTQYLNLNTTSQAITNATNNFSSVTSDTFTSYLAGSGDIVCYCFHSVDGYQKVGSYTGNATSGNVVTTGFRPRFVIIKGVSGNSAATHWTMVDSVRDTGTVIDKIIYANLANAEADFNNARAVEFTDTGFELYSTGSDDLNDSSTTYIYLAIA